MTKDLFHHLQTELSLQNDEQVPNTYSHYADIPMETLLLKRSTKNGKRNSTLKLNPTYSYARIYKNG